MENVQNKGSAIMDKNKKSRTSIEMEGANVEDAIKKALSVLSVSRDDIKVKIVCEEQKGLFGMEGVKPAKIRVTLKK